MYYAVIQYVKIGKNSNSRPAGFFLFLFFSFLNLYLWLGAWCLNVLLVCLFVFNCTSFVFLGVNEPSTTILHYLSESVCFYVCSCLLIPSTKCMPMPFFFCFRKKKSQINLYFQTYYVSLYINMSYTFLDIDGHGHTPMKTFVCIITLQLIVMFY